MADEGSAGGASRRAASSRGVEEGIQGGWEWGYSSGTGYMVQRVGLGEVQRPKG